VFDVGSGVLGELMPSFYPSKHNSKAGDTRLFYFYVSPPLNWDLMGERSMRSVAGPPQPLMPINTRNREWLTKRKGNDPPFSIACIDGIKRLRCLTARHSSLSSSRKHN